MLYQSGLDGTLQRYRDDHEVYRIKGTIVPIFVFTSSSSFFVALIVLLRLLMVKRPMSYERTHERVSRIGCIVIWVMSLALPSISFVISLPYFYNPKIYSIANLIESQALLTAPILLTVAIYVMLLCTLRPDTTAGDTTSIRMKALVKMTHGIVIGLVVCNVPGLAYLAYLTTMLNKGKLDDEIFKSNISV